jgi:hypothetical protein
MDDLRHIPEEDWEEYQFKGGTLFRGERRHRDLSPEQFSSVGIHWTPSKHVAHEFAGDNGTVFEAHVDPEHVLQPGSEDWHEAREAYDIMHPESDESEVTLKPGTIITINKTHHVTKDPITGHPKVETTSYPEEPYARIGLGY